MKTVTLECKQGFYDNGQIAREEYSIDGKRHNPNGLAYTDWHDNGKIAIEEYWIDGKELTKEEFDKITNPNPCNCNGKTIEVEGKKYKLKAI